MKLHRAYWHGRQVVSPGVVHAEELTLRPAGAGGDTPDRDYGNGWTEDINYFILHTHFSV